MSPLIFILLLILLAALLYWQLILAEGAYLGKRVVAWLYDVVATRYNSIKQYDPDDDARFLGEPLVMSLQGESDPLVLDVATGTSRLPLALCQQPLFHGRIIALDNARRMLREATRYVADHRERVTWMWSHAVPLPFDDNTFELVTCLEALEFMPDTPAALAECVRVLKPGGMLLVSNRIATGAKVMPGKTFSKVRFEALLQSLGQSDVTTQVWQFDYDLVWSIKPDNEDGVIPSPEGTRNLSANGPHGLSDAEIPRSPCPPPSGGGAPGVARNDTLLRCPIDRGLLDQVNAAYQCRTCSRRYPIGADGVIELLR